MKILGFEGSRFTWKWGRVHERLDRALVNEKWDTPFGKTVVKHLPSAMSDHSPLLISFRGRVNLPKRGGFFKYWAAWEAHDNWEDWLTANWNNDLEFLEAIWKLTANINDWKYNIFESRLDIIDLFPTTENGELQPQDRLEQNPERDSNSKSNCISNHRKERRNCNLIIANCIAGKDHYKLQPLGYAGVPRRAYWIWRGILSSRDVIRKALLFIIGNGNSTRVWVDPQGIQYQLLTLVKP
ncbi:Unknown protein [Striga hermonthica]|uniref:Reverse transcriptase n=1 Tax=Striga hermonthica TaxID=68872 RepID=A0A9N7RJD6_STRHE|nr:Unknown protein [Striga hermonthica]